MTAIYYVFIVLPILIFGMLHFVFQNGSAETLNAQIKANCPYPINAGIANNTNIVGSLITYDLFYDTDSDDYHVTVFECSEDPISGSPTVSTIIYTADVGNAWFDFTNRASGYMFYISETITAWAQKAQATLTVAYLFIDAPAQVSGLSFFSYLNAILAGFVGLGLFMVVRGT